MEMLSPSGADRVPISDESIIGDPNRWLSLTGLLSWIQSNISLNASRITAGVIASARIPCGLAAIDYVWYAGFGKDSGLAQYCQGRDGGV